MSLLTETPGLAAYAIASTTIALQLVALALWTGRVRVQKNRWVNPEDAKAAKGEQVDEEDDDVARVKRAHVNLLENAVPFFVVGALFVATAPSRTASIAYFGTFVGARILHSIFYLWGRQPFRTLSFGVGVLAIAGMAVHVLRAAL
jgi:glutathione S-transferase